MHSNVSGPLLPALQAPEWINNTRAKFTPCSCWLWHKLLAAGRLLPGLTLQCTVTAPFPPLTLGTALPPNLGISMRQPLWLSDS